MLIAFDTLNIYYLPQYQPIIKELLARGHQVALICYRNKNSESEFTAVLKDMGSQVTWVDNERDALNHYLEIKADWVFFGNAFEHLESLHSVSRSAQVGHGIGPKPSYYHKSRFQNSVRFMEGKLRLDKIRHLYPNSTFIQTGYAKLDPIFKGEQAGFDLNAAGLDSNKQTILYAPTFNPSSLERFPNHWPQDFADYNILIKPHTFTYTRKQYAGQRRKLAKWAEFTNTYVATEQDVNLVPFMASADILLSEASSTLFEFAALGKPVIVCDFFKLKWSYRGPFAYRFNKRFGKDNVLYKDIGLHVSRYRDLLTAIPNQLAEPEQYANNRAQYTNDHVGPTDGLAAKRIVDYLERTSIDG